MGRLGKDRNLCENRHSGASPKFTYTRSRRRPTATAASRTFVLPMSVNRSFIFAAKKLSRPAWPAGPDGHVATRINPGSEPLAFENLWHVVAPDADDGLVRLLWLLMGEAEIGGADGAIVPGKTGVVVQRCHLFVGDQRPLASVRR